MRKLVCWWKGHDWPEEGRLSMTRLLTCRRCGAQAYAAWLL